MLNIGMLTFAGYYHMTCIRDVLEAYPCMHIHILNVRSFL